MKRILFILPLLAMTGLAACSDPQVTVHAAVQNEATGEQTPLAKLPIRLLPYDRDAIFDSLTAASAEPEPQIPPEILQQQEAVQEAQTEWQNATDRWGVVRDSLKTLAAGLQQMQNQGLRNTPQYKQAFEQFGRLEQEERRVKQAADASFQQFTSLQQSALTQADSIRLIRERWAERAFESYDDVVAAKLAERGVEELADTTNAQGVATFRAPEGQWWVYARYALPYQELYWNVPIEVTGDSTVVRLTEENAKPRPML